MSKKTIESDVIKVKEFITCSTLNAQECIVGDTVLIPLEEAPENPTNKIYCIDGDLYFGTEKLTNVKPTSSFLSIPKVELFLENVDSINSVPNIANIAKLYARVGDFDPLILTLNPKFWLFRWTRRARFNIKEGNDVVGVRPRSTRWRHPLTTKNLGDQLNVISNEWDFVESPNARRLITINPSDWVLIEESAVYMSCLGKKKMVLPLNNEVKTRARICSYFGIAVSIDNPLLTEDPTVYPKRFWGPITPFIFGVKYKFLSEQEQVPYYYYKIRVG